ncbi:MAG: YetF domain-containing protein, partial [Heyndrickxia sp.]
MQDLSLLESPVYLPIALIIDGEVLRDNLHELGFNQQWLDNQLTTNGYDNVKRILYADWRENEGIHISPK